MSWPLNKLKDITQLIDYGLTASANNEVQGPLFLRITDLTDSGVNWSKVPRCECDDKHKLRNLLVKGDIVFARTGATTGKSYLISDLDEDTVFASYLIRVRPNKDIFSPYLAHFFKSPIYWHQIGSMSSGATLPGVNASKLGQLEIPLPPLDEQKRIAAILDKADAIRRKRQQAIQLADDFLRSVFLDMFGDPVTNPKGWEVKRWSDVLKIVNGKNQKAVLADGGKYPIMGSGGEMGRASEYLTPENSVIIGRKGNINKPILVKENFWNVDTAFGLVPKPSILSFNYLYWFCKFFDFERLNKAVTIPSLTKVDLLQISIPLPDITKQTRFDEVVNKIESIISKNINSSQSTNDIFNSLSQKAFAGEL